jgi:hypothetical protein
MNLKKQWIVFSFFCFSSQLASAQVLEVLVEAFLIDGFWYTLVESPDEPHWTETTYASYPYDLRGSGLYLPLDLEGDQSRFNLNFHFQNNEEGRSGAFAQIKYAPISLLTIEANRLQYYEADKPEGVENINLTSFSILYNRLRHHKIHAWWGVGGVWLDDEENSSSPTFQFGANYFFTDPLSLYGEVQISGLNSEVATIVQGRIQVHLRRFLIYGGYHHVDIGDLEIGSWMIGFGAYF